MSRRGFLQRAGALLAAAVAVAVGRKARAEPDLRPAVQRVLSEWWPENTFAGHPVRSCPVDEQGWAPYNLDPPCDMFGVPDSHGLLWHERDANGQWTQRYVKVWGK